MITVESMIGSDRVQTQESFGVDDTLDIKRSVWVNNKEWRIKEMNNRPMDPGIC